jgi:hypothetical protein
VKASKHIFRVMCVITAANNWAHVLWHNCNKSSVHWTYRRTFPAPPVTTAFHTGMTCRCKSIFFRGYLRVGRTVYCKLKCLPGFFHLVVNLISST